ncbi:MAG: nicotinate (nicotinamide) nucleotide adenylyltransferase [Oscillospiraceae bacterium]|nr:nicotinate (nicotinamide) nucleotide adenylyltransferase [Oscillospiraceae bacterium]
MRYEKGLFGGSFNPIHNGHLHLAESVKEQLALDEIVLMPTGEAPHKSSDAYAAPQHRLAMCQLAAEEYDWMSVSDYEIQKQGKSYTVDTLRMLTAQSKDTRWNLMIGSDMLLIFDQWRSWEEILKLARLCVVSREYNDLPVLQEKAELLKKSCCYADIIVLSVQAFPVSSTQIRQNVKKNADCSCLLPKNVVKYIGENRLYLNSQL